MEYKKFLRLLTIMAIIVGNSSTEQHTRRKRFVGSIYRFLFPPTEPSYIVPNYPIFKVRKYNGYEIRPVLENEVADLQTVQQPEANVEPLKIIKAPENNDLKLQSLLDLDKAQDGYKAVYNLVSTGIVTDPSIRFDTPVVIPDLKPILKPAVSYLPEKAPTPTKLVDSSSNSSERTAAVSNEVSTQRPTSGSGGSVFDSDHAYIGGMV